MTRKPSTSRLFSSPFRKAPKERVPRNRRLYLEQLEARNLLAVSSVELLEEANVSGATGEKPQSKLWEYNNTWWGAWSRYNGVYVHRLDGTVWTPVLKLSSATTVKTDVKTNGGLTHILLHDDHALQLASLEYVASSPPTYRLWSERSSLTGVNLGSDAEAATIDLDSQNRLWVAYDNVRNIEVRYSDAPYTAWSAPVVLASNVDDDDIAVVTALAGGKIGVLWSNQTTKRFGFRTHADGAAPSAWSADEVPAAQSAQNIGGGMADDHLNVAVASDGTLYVAAKTSYDANGAPQVVLLVRRPSGAWDNLRQVDTVGTRPSVQLNETTGHLLYSYRLDEAEPIVYRECSTVTFACTARRTLLSESSLNNPSSTKQTYTDDLVIIAGSGIGEVHGARLRFSTGQNQAPVVNAGLDQAISGVSTQLQGSVSDDGLPIPPGHITTHWTKVSGPGEAAFAQADAASTAVTFSQPGAYVLRLTASDGELTAADDVLVEVIAQTSPVLLASFRDGHSPTSSYAGTRDATIKGDRQTTNYGSASSLEVDGWPDAAALIQWDIREIPAGSIVSDVSLTWNVTDATTSTFKIYELKRPWVESQVTWRQSASGNAWETPGALGPTDRGSTPLGEVRITSKGRATLQLNAAGKAVVQGWVDRPTTNFGLIIQEYANSSSDLLRFDSRQVRQVSRRPELEIAYEPNQGPVVYAGPDQTVTVEDTVSLQGEVSGAGSPNTTLTSQWTKVNGPGTVTFGDASLAATTAAFSLPGVYTLRLTASDGNLSAWDEVVVTVQQAQAQTLTFRNGVSPTAGYGGARDATITSEQAHTNFGGSWTLEMDGVPDIAALVQWNLGEIPSGSVVDSVRLTFNVPNASPQTYKIYELKQPWVESEVTWTQFAAGVPWQSAGASGAGDRGATALGQITATSVGEATLELNAAGVAVVQNWINNPATNFGLILQEYGDANDNRLRLDSREITTAANRPAITIVFREEDSPEGEGASPVAVAVAFQDGTGLSGSYHGTQDTTIAVDSRNTNLGSSDTLEADGSPDLATLIRWDVAAIPSGSAVESASITLQVTNRTDDAYEVYGLKRPWVESEATWTQPSAGETWESPGVQGVGDRDATALASFTAPSTGEITVPLNAAGVALVQAWVDNPSTNHGLIFMDYDGASNGVEFRSREAALATDRPKLTITYSPPPAPANLLVGEGESSRDEERVGALLGAAAWRARLDENLPPLEGRSDPHVPPADRDQPEPDDDFWTGLAAPSFLLGFDEHNDG